MQHPPTVARAIAALLARTVRPVAAASVLRIAYDGAMPPEILRLYRAALFAGTPREEEAGSVADALAALDGKAAA